MIELCDINRVCAQNQAISTMPSPYLCWEQLNTNHFGIVKKVNGVWINLLPKEDFETGIGWWAVR